MAKIAGPNRGLACSATQIDGDGKGFLLHRSGGQGFLIARRGFAASEGINVINRQIDALDPQTDTSAVSPGYLVLSPYSYSQTFNVGAVPADTAAVQLQFTYDFLVQTTPTSKEYAKQTASDTLTVAIFQPGE